MTCERENTLPLMGIVMSLCDAMDLVSPHVIHHHHRVAYIADSIAEALGLPPEERANLLWAGLLHDSGAFALRDRLQYLEFELSDPGCHAELGYRLLQGVAFLDKAGHLIRYHHTRWDGGLGAEHMGEPVPLGSHILHLADRLAVISGSQQGILCRADSLVERMREQSGSMFVPELVDILAGLAARYHFWLDLTSPSIRRVLEGQVCAIAVPMDLAALRDVSRILCRLIDFRSRFTATHSRGVAVAAATLGRYARLDQETCDMLEIAGHIHDVGKLAIPLELLEKPGRFTQDDFSIIKSHPYHTYRVLENVTKLDNIRRWASFHHERLDGRGYPFCLKGDDLSVEARIVAVADVFTALAEDRPYRPGMSSPEVSNVLERMAASGHLDPDLVSLLVKNSEELHARRVRFQAAAAAEYRLLRSPGATFPDPSWPASAVAGA
jgi:HD-GYP domain-containing protein (c-di-GMP phosphodiesterase class II)